MNRIRIIWPCAADIAASMAMGITLAGLILALAWIIHSLK